MTPEHQRVWDACAQLGKAIEALPPEERRNTLEQFLREQGWDLSGQALTFVLGVFVTAHWYRFEREAWAEEVRRERNDGGVSR